MSNALQRPSAQHWFGTDQLGMDIFSRVIVGTRVSLAVGLLAVSIAMTVGVILGSIAGYIGGRVDTAIMRVMDMMLAIPSILLAITPMAALGKGIDKAVIAIGLVSIPEYARDCPRQHPLHQGERLRRGHSGRRQQQHPHHLQTRAPQRPLGDHYPGHPGHVERYSRPGRPWVPRYGHAAAAGRMGDMLGRGRGFIFQAPYTLFFPGMAITLTVLAFNLLGDGLRDALDPKCGTNERCSCPVHDLCGRLRTVQGDRPRGESMSPSRCARVRSWPSWGSRASGKSVTALSVMGLLLPPGRVVGGEVIFGGAEPVALSKREMLKCPRRSDLAMIFQEPTTSLNPVFTVENQNRRKHRAIWTSAARTRPWTSDRDAASRGHPGFRERSGTTPTRCPGGCASG